MATCAECGGALVDGSVGFPVLGGPRFSYKVKTMSVSADITARMCETCGLVEFRVTDPRRIRTARDAMRRAEGQG